MHLDDALALGRALLAEHGLTGWTLAVDGARTRAGLTRFGPRVISLSGPLTLRHTEDEVRDTLLHEIAHALAGPGAGHGPRWRSHALAIGCTATRCVSPDAARVDGDWVGTCPAGHRTTAHRRPRRVRSCAECSPRFDPGALLAWTYRGEPAPMHPQYLAEVAAIARAATAAAVLPGSSRRPDARNPYVRNARRCRSAPGCGCSGAGAGPGPRASSTGTAARATTSASGRRSSRPRSRSSRRSTVRRT